MASRNISEDKRATAVLQALMYIQSYAAEDRRRSSSSGDDGYVLNAFMHTTIIEAIDFGCWSDDAVRELVAVIVRYAPEDVLDEMCAGAIGERDWTRKYWAQLERASRTGNGPLRGCWKPTRAATKRAPKRTSRPRIVARAA